MFHFINIREFRYRYLFFCCLVGAVNAVLKTTLWFIKRKLPQHKLDLYDLGSLNYNKVYLVLTWMQWYLPV